MEVPIQLPDRPYLLQQWKGQVSHQDSRQVESGGLETERERLSQEDFSEEVINTMQCSVRGSTYFPDAPSLPLI